MASKIPTTKPNYGNWASKKLIYIPSLIGLFLAGLSLILPLLAIPAILFLAISLYFAYARARFSPGGGDVQTKIQGLLLDRLDWDGSGKALDIGCGNAPLTVALARKYPRAEITGVDYWGKAWEYSLGVCTRNAELEGAADRVVFQKASASVLPFPDGTFDAALSNLVFHEVRDARDKKEVVREALRVVKKGGAFAFQDLFLWQAVYGEIDELLAAIKSWGVESVAFTPTNGAEFIPGALKLPFMVGTIGILHGRK